MYTTRNTPYDFWGKGALFGIPFAAVLVVVILLVFQFILKKTRPGRQIYITGGGKETAFLSGINTNKIKICVFVIAGVCAAFAGIIMSSRTTAASYAMGNGADFDACIAVLIGGNVLGGGKGGMVQTFIGILIFGLISNILNLAGIVPVIQIILKGVILLLAILLDGIKQD